MRVALKNRKQQRQDEECRRGISRDFGQNRAGPGAKGSVRRRATEGQPSACFLFRELNEHQQDEDRTQQNHCKRQKAENKTHIWFPFFLHYRSEASNCKRNPAANSPYPRDYFLASTTSAPLVLPLRS